MKNMPRINTQKKVANTEKFQEKWMEKKEESATAV